MKKIFFHKGFLLSLFLMNCVVLMAQRPAVITYPLDNSVFQQSGVGNGNVPIAFAGQFLKGSYLPYSAMQAAKVSVDKYNYTNKTWAYFNTYDISTTMCQNCSNSLAFDPATFYSTINLGNLPQFEKGWYRATIILPIQCPIVLPEKIGSRTLSESINFGVGDVYYVAGQSNASGFDRDDDTGLMLYESSSAGGPPKPELTGAFIEEGSIVNRIITGRKDYTNGQFRQVKGLPLYPPPPTPSSPTLGLQKFVSGSLEPAKEMGIAPNGFDSWSWCRFSNELVKTRKYPVLLFNVARPNTSVADWNNTLFDSHLKKMLQMYGGAFGAKAVLWQQGENETELLRQVANSSTLYASNIKSLIEKSRDQAIPNLKWMISKTSYNVTASTTDPGSLFNRVAFSPELASGFKYKLTSNEVRTWQTAAIINSQIGRVYAGPITEPENATITGELDDKYRGPAKRLHFHGVQEVGYTENGLQVLAERWYNAALTLAETDNSIAQNPLKVIVTKTGTQYSLSLQNGVTNAAVTSGSFYWVINENGIENSVSSAATYLIPTSVANDYYITCYHQATATQVLTPSQPYLVKKTCSSCRIGSTNSTVVVRPTRTIPSTGSTIYEGYDNIKDNLFPKFPTCPPNWLSISSNQNNELVITANANTTGQARSANIVITDSDANNTAYLTIPIEQAGTTTSCTPTSLLTRNVASTSAGWTQNVTTINTTPVINGVAFVNGGVGGSLSVLSNNTRRIDLGGGFTAFTGKVGRDDSQDGCNCAIMDMGFKIINTSNGQVLFNSVLHGVNTPAEAFNINVSGVQQIELQTLVGTDGWNWGDLGNWVELQLHCGAVPPPCTVQVPTNPTVSATNQPPNSSITLSTTCGFGTPVWSTGNSANSVVVNPAVTTTYSVYCNNGASCVSSSVNVTVNVGTASGCGILSNNMVLGTWSVTGNQLVARQFNGNFWLTQQMSSSPNQFVVRASEMLLRGDVTTTYASLVGCFPYQNSDYGGLLTPTSTQFPTPINYSLVSFTDGTPTFLFNTSTSPPSYNGFLDNANCATISGWAWNGIFPNGTVGVEILEGSTVVASGAASNFRQDLQNAGFGNGQHGFSIATPSSLKNGQPHTLSARITGSGYTLNTTPKTITGCSNMRVAAEGSSQEPKKPLTAAPNPSSGIFSLNFSANIGEMIDLQIISVAGRTVLTQQFTAESTDVFHVINLEKQPAGEYIVQVLRKNQKESLKILKVE